MESYASFPRHQRNKPTPLHQPAVWMAHGVSSSVELVQGSHAVPRVQLRFRAFCEYLWDCCAHQMDQSICPSCTAYWWDNRLFPASVTSSNLVVSVPICNSTFWIASSLQQWCFIGIFTPVAKSTGPHIWLLISFLKKLSNVESFPASFHGDWKLSLQFVNLR